MIISRANLIHSVKLILLLIMFAPITINVGNSSVSANYLFILLFFIGGVKLPENWDLTLCLYIAFCIVSYIIGIFLFSNYDDYFLWRQLISFIIFLLPILILFIHISFSIDEICRTALIAAIIYSVYTFWIVINHGLLLSDDTFGVRSFLEGFIPDYPQRFIIIILFSIFFAFSRIELNSWHVPVFLLLLFSIYISFTRAAWIGLAAGFVAYIVSIVGKAEIISGIRFNLVKTFRWTVLFTVVLVGISLVISTTQIHEGIVLHLNRSIDALSGIISYDTADFNPDGSEGLRLQIWSAILDIVAENPITGSGFAGAHQFLGDEWGSAHSQYLDVLLRTGFVGLCFYLFLWIKAFRFYFTVPGIFAGLIAVFTFGFFQETTKMSYGALLFFLLLNKVYESKYLTEKAS